MVPLGVGQRSQLSRRERESERTEARTTPPLLLGSSNASRRRIKTAETSVVRRLITVILLDRGGSISAFSPPPRRIRGRPIATRLSRDVETASRALLP